MQGLLYTSSEFASDLGRGGPVAMTFGPHDGDTALYYTTYAGGDGGQVRRISYAGDNRAPSAAVRITGNNYGPRDKQFRFSGQESTDPDDDPLTYEWDFGDGTTGTGPTASHTYDAKRRYTVTLTVEDDTGKQDTATVEVFPGDTAPPQPEIESPAANDLFEVGQRITRRGSATDADDGQLPEAALKWEVIQHHNGDHTHPYSTGTGNDSTFTAPPPEDILSTDPSGNYLEVRLTATNSQGLSKTVTRKLKPKTVAVRLQTRPTGLKLEVNGKPF